jgi:hypothetical protein
VTPLQFMLRMAIIQTHEQQIHFLNKAKALMPSATFLIAENIAACQDFFAIAVKSVECD